MYVFLVRSQNDKQHLKPTHTTARFQLRTWVKVSNLAISTLSICQLSSVLLTEVCIICKMFKWVLNMFIEIKACFPFNKVIFLLLTFLLVLFAMLIYSLHFYKRCISWMTLFNLIGSKASLTWSYIFFEKGPGPIYYHIP